MPEVSTDTRFWDLEVGFHERFKTTTKFLSRTCREPVPVRNRAEGGSREDISEIHVVSARDERRMADTAAYFSARNKGGSFAMARFLSIEIGSCSVGVDKFNVV